MAYADQKMSGNKMIALVIVFIIHALVGYVLITGLAYSAFKKVVERVATVNIDEPTPTPTEEPPPPKPETMPPPPVAPPPPISVATSPPQIVTQVNIPPPAPVVREVVPAPPAPVIAPPPPKFPPKNAEPRGNPGTWVTTNDYPSRALREEREGTTRFTLSIDSSGKVTNCQITGSSGSPDLDDAACKNLQRRARFKPATDGNGDAVPGSYSSSVRWQIPK